MLTSIFLKGLVVGFLIAAPVGPVNVMCVRRTIMHGRLVGLVSGLGAAAADTIFGAIAAFGLSFVYELLMTERFWLGIAGGALLMVMGVRTLFAEPPRPSDTPDPPNLLGDFTSTLVLTLTNPVTIVSFLAAFTAVGVAADPGEPIGLDDWILLLGVFLGASTWWLFITAAVALFHGRIPLTMLRWTNRVAGVVILAFAVGVLWVVFNP
ncbi:MAG: LysE family translocator [Alphaproteobacteria bacterium]|nr:LysE family translocator [Alphaproteobacteria bacterium]